jgi:hypothetical protein
MFFKIWDLIPEQEGLSNKKKNIDQVCEILDRIDIDTSRHSLKSWAAGGNTVDPEKCHNQMNEHIQIILGGNVVQKNSMIYWIPAAIENNAALEGQLHISIWVYPLKTWLWLPTDVIAQLYWNECQKDEHHQDWLWDHLLWIIRAHFTAWIWVINWTSLMRLMHFFSQSN